MDRLNEMDAFSDGFHMMVPVEDAQNHMRQHIGAGGNGEAIDMGGKMAAAVPLAAAKSSASGGNRQKDGDGPPISGGQD